MKEVTDALKTRISKLFEGLERLRVRVGSWPYAGGGAHFKADLGDYREIRMGPSVPGCYSTALFRQKGSFRGSSSFKLRVSYLNFLTPRVCTRPLITSPPRCSVEPLPPVTRLGLVSCLSYKNNVKLRPTRTLSGQNVQFADNQALNPPNVLHERSPGTKSRLQ
jgi:hypothetical protein